MLTASLLHAMRQHREVARVFHTLRRDNDGDISEDMQRIAGMSLDDAHMRHWYELQKHGIEAGTAGTMCAAISRYIP